MKADYKFIGKRIREERLKLRLTQENLSELVGISDSYLGQIERGEKCLTLDTLLSLANKLGVSVDYLLKDYTKTNDDNFIDQFKQLINGRSLKEKQMAIDILKVTFSHIDEL